MMQRSEIARCVCVCFCLSLVVSTAYAQNHVLAPDSAGTLNEEGVPIHPVDGKYIKQWLVIGPFFSDEPDTDFLATSGGEANADPNIGWTRR